MIEINSFKEIIFLCINLLLFLSNSTKGVPQLRNGSQMFPVTLHINKKPHTRTVIAKDMGLLLNKTA